MQLKGRNFLKLMDYTPEEITYLIDLSQELKEKKKKGIRHDELTGKNIALIFEKTSTRTRCSFEVAAHDLGMHVTYLDPSGSQIGKKESIADTARVLGRMFDGIEYRGYGQEIVEELAKYAGVPVWNGLTNEFHPTQMIADMLTIREHLGRLGGVKFVYIVILNVIFFMLCLKTSLESGFPVTPIDFCVNSLIYIIPNLLMICCVYTITAVIFKNPLPAAPILFLHIIYSNMLTMKNDIYYMRPFSIMVRFPGRFFETHVAKMSNINQIMLVISSVILVCISVTIWKRRRVH